MGTEITKVYALPKTPTSVIAFLIILSVIYIAQKGGKVVGRVNELLFYILLLDIVFFLPPIILGDYTNLLPVGESGFSKIIKGAIPTTFAYEGMEVLLLTYSMVTRKEEVLKAGITAIGIIMFIYLIIVIIALLVSGPEVLQLSIWPTISLLKMVDFPVIERFELFFLIFWLGLASRPAMNSSCFVSYSIIKLLNLNIERYYTFAVTGVGLLTYALALIPNDLTEVFKFANYAGYASWVAAVGFPLLFNTAALLQKEKVKKNG